MGTAWCDSLGIGVGRLKLDRNMRTTIVVSALFLGTCMDNPGDRGGVHDARPDLSRTPGGAVYHAGNCVPDDDRGRLVTFAPGTGLPPDYYSQRADLNVHRAHASRGSGRRLRCRRRARDRGREGVPGLRL